MTFIESLISIVIAALGSSGLWAFLTAQLAKKKTGQRAEKDALLGLLHVKIYEDCEHLLAQGYTTKEDVENLEYLYKPYRELGGNGTCEKLYSSVGKMELKVEGGEKNETEK